MIDLQQKEVRPANPKLQ
jgi:hypothetical protein